MPRKIIPYNPKLKQFAKRLRKDMTLGEVLLWNELKGDGIWGFDFDRQRCIDNYIVDFYCKDLALAIEVDGIYHSWEEIAIKDDERQQRLQSLGVIIIRFAESEVKNDMINVIRAIEGQILDIIKDDPDIDLPPDFDISLLDSTT